MARNKYPEETVNKILEVSMKLFLEKGFENTSIQDIVDQLGGLSKGAIYHHFKSKEEILLAVMDKIYASHDDEWEAIRDEEHRFNGQQKLKRIFEASLNNRRQDEIFGMAPNFIKNPQMLALQLQGIFEESGPLYLQPIMEQGMADGSIQTEYPKELAEVLLILINIWLTPMVHYDGFEALKGRVRFFQDLLSRLNLDLFDDPMLERFEEFARLYEKKQQNSKTRETE